MLKRALYITTALRLSVKNNQLVIESKDKPEVMNTVPIEDIGYLIVEKKMALNV